MGTGVLLLFNLLYAYDGELKWSHMLIRKCVLENSSYFYMRVSNVKIKILQKILKQKNSKNLLVNLEINIKYCPTNLRVASFGIVEP